MTGKVITQYYHTMQLRPTTIADLPTLFTFQLDEVANHMAAFIPANYADKDAYIAKWANILAEGNNPVYTILVDGQIAGTISGYQMEGDWQITYWIDKAQWGKGIATQAAKAFLQLFGKRPIYGRAAFDNHGSIKVLENCGFVKAGTDVYHSHARGEEIGEVIFELR